MRELVRGAIMIGLAACGGGGTKSPSSSLPASTAAVDCGSIARVITDLLADKDTTDQDRNAVNAAVSRRCEDDRWTSDARSCFVAASSRDGLTTCGYRNLTQEQQDKLDEVTAPLTTFNVARALQQMETFTAQMCACKDAACAERVSDDMTKWSMELSKQENEPPKMSEADVQRAQEIGQRISACMQTAMGAALGGVSGGGAASVELTSLEPARGDSSGGTQVKITGANFVDEGPRNAKVYFGETEGKVVSFDSDSQMTVEAPSGKPNETVDVRVVFDPGGELTLPKAFTFEKTKRKKKKKK